MFKINEILFNRYLDNNIPDIHHATYYNYFTKKKNIPTVITVHDLTHEKISKKNLYPKQKSLTCSDHIICVSKSTKNDLMQIYNIDSEKISVVYESGGISFNHHNLYEIKSNDQKPYILFVGSRHGYKNWKILIDAYSASNYLKRNFNIIFFGGGKFNNEEKKIIKEKKISSNIIIAQGSDQQLLKLYNNCEIFVYPSLYEGFGLTLLEALSLKKRILCSDIDIFREICDDAVSYFDPLNFNDLKDKLENILINNVELNVDLAQKVIKKFSWEKCASGTLDVYKKVIK